MYIKYFTILLLPLIICLAGCSKKQNNEMENQNKATAIKAIQVFDNGNTDELNSLSSANFVEHQLDTSMTKKTGIEADKEIFAKFHKIIPDLKTTIYSIAVTGDTVFVHDNTVGTTKEPFMDIPANRQISLEGVDIFRFESNKIAEHWGYIDYGKLMSLAQPAIQSNSTMMENKNK